MKILILSDVHANRAALGTVLAAESGFDQLFFVGDLVDYGTEPAPCLDLVRRAATLAVRGNHDQALGFGTDCGCRGDFRQLSQATRAWHQTLLAEGDRAYLRSLPLEAQATVGATRFYLTHAAPGNNSSYLDRRALVAAVAGIEADVILVGHTHVQWAERVGERWIANPGSVGLSRDQAGEACYAVWEGGTVDLRRLAYPVAQAVAELEESPLAAPVKEALIRVLGEHADVGSH
jgi:protein phosphatase